MDEFSRNSTPGAMAHARFSTFLSSVIGTLKRRRWYRRETPSAKYPPRVSAPTRSKTGSRLTAFGCEGDVVRPWTVNTTSRNGNKTIGEIIECRYGINGSAKHATTTACQYARRTCALAARKTAAARAAPAL